jgi:O-antigen/teichoic acid export membrane protein
MSLIATPTETGYFSVAFRIVEALIMVPSLLISAAFPVLSHAADVDEQRLRYVVQRMFEISVIGGAWLAMSTVAGARLGVDVIAGSKFHPSISVLKLQGIALGATFLVFAGGYALLALRRNRALIIANVFAVCVVLVATLVLGHLYAADGAAVAMIIGEASLCVAYGIALLRGGRIRLTLSIVPRVALAVGIAAAAGLLAPVPNFTLVPLTSILFFASLALLGAFPSELRDALRRKRFA